MINEEYCWADVEGTLSSIVSCVFVGPAKDQRAQYFPRLWNTWDCLLVRIEADPNLEFLTFSISKGGQPVRDNQRLTVTTGLRGILSSLGESNLEVVCIDMTSLQPAVLMFLTKLLTAEVRPSHLFGTYAEPEEYARKADDEYLLSSRFMGLRSVPGYATRTGSGGRLLAFLGFEGDRLAKILDEVQFDDVIPIVGFPAYQPGWQNRSLVSCMGPIQHAASTVKVEKCSAVSIYDAFALIGRLRGHEPQVALAPLGTRPHTVACAMYAATHPKTHLLYDHPVEQPHRSVGIGPCRCYHLTPLMKSGAEGTLDG